MSRKIRTLLFSSLYPSSVRPGHGVFVETRLRELLKSGRIETKIVSPVPWFYSTDAKYGNYALMARTPQRETYHGIDVLHPRYLLPPKVGMTIAPFSMAFGALSTITRLQREGFEIDLIDAHYFYPDGVAAALLAKWLRKPLVVTARGTDLNVIPAFALPRKMIRWAASSAQATIGVSNSLAEILRGWGLPRERINVMRNGVDLDRFRPMPPMEMRGALGISGSPVIMSVGHLVELKGHDLAIRALAQVKVRFPDASLVIVGQGPQEGRLKALATELNVFSSILFAGARPNDELCRWYSAADILILASSREGWPNVLLESMACGTPVVATRVGGTPEIVLDNTAGNLVDVRDASSFADSIFDLFQRSPNRSTVRTYAESFGWDATTEAQVELFERLTNANAACQSG